jgi:hypothetical protein
MPAKISKCVVCGRFCPTYDKTPTAHGNIHKGCRAEYDEQHGDKGQD